MDGKIHSVGTNFGKEPETEIQIRSTVLHYFVHYISKSNQIVFSSLLQNDYIFLLLEPFLAARKRYNCSERKL